MRHPIDPRWQPQPWSEIYEADCYRVKQLDFQPGTVYDIGGNLGCFAVYAQMLWPECHVISVEPHPSNFAILKEHAEQLPRVTAVHAALGTSPAHWFPAAGGESNPGGHGYLCECIGFDANDLKSFAVAECPTLSMRQIATLHPPTGDYVVKLDTEGAEECLLHDDDGTEFLRGARYIAAELHFVTGRWREVPEADKLKPGLLSTHGHVIRAFMDWIYGFSDTHVVTYEIGTPNAGMMWCKRR